MSNQLQILDTNNIDAFTSQNDYVLILGKSGCEVCNKWQQELEAVQEQDQLPEVPIGKLNLDQRKLADFKRNTEWLKDVNDLPFTAIYSNGELAKSFAGGGLERLVKRLQRVGLVSASAS